VEQKPSLPVKIVPLFGVLECRSIGALQKATSFNVSSISITPRGSSTGKEPGRLLGSGCFTFLRQNAPWLATGMNGEESPPKL
jgi:hypothetical protein